MNESALLALIGDLYAQVATLTHDNREMASRLQAHEAPNETN